MSFSDWAPAVGATLGAIVGAGGTAAVHTYNHRTRWDERILTCYANYLGKAAATFGSCCMVIERSGIDAQDCTSEFQARYETLEPIYEELLLLDEECRDHARRLMWVLWHAGRQDIAEAQDLLEVTRVYRDARHHVRRRAEKRLIHPGKRYRWQAGGCQGETHSSPLGQPTQPDVWVA